MTTENMNVHKALSELKLLDVRISKAIHNANFVVTNKHSNTKIAGIPKEDFIKSMQGDYDKAVELIKRRTAIKRAVQLSNAMTTLTVAGEEMTVAEAIEMKNHSLQYKTEMLQIMNDQYTKALSSVITANGKTLEERAEKYVIGIYGGKDVKVDPDDYEKTKKAFIENNQFELVDPLSIKEKIDALQDEITNFTSEVDSALSVSNAVTIIEIKY
jgi:hypothetical protein